MTTKLILAAALATTVYVTPPALAQEDEERELRGRSFVIELDDEGHVVVDGEPLTEDDGPVVLRIRPDGKEIEIESIEPRTHARMLARALHPARRYALHANWDWDDGADFMVDLDRPVEPLLDGFKFEVGDRMRIAAEEHMEVAELERESRELARDARRADGQEREELEADLREKLAEVFDKKMEVRRDRVERLDEQITEEREKIEARRAAREEMIDRRLRRLMGEEDLLEW